MKDDLLREAMVLLRKMNGHSCSCHPCKKEEQEATALADHIMEHFEDEKVIMEKLRQRKSS